jgi:UDP-N-acetylglucosamine--N-acetylmuramyl-(pentapeptide) pyrophosphoryl-undecaprenol N-acetylglucosamine transferase
MASVPKPRAVEAGFRLVVAGGGTGGHLFPGIAVAQAFSVRHRRNQVLFVNAGRPLETEVLSRLGWPQRVIAIEGIKGRGLWRQITAAVKVPRAITQSVSIFREFRPDVVLGVGGYSAGPAVMAAWMMGIRTALHEQNQLPGLTNRLLRRIVDRIYLTFEDDALRFDARRTLVTGNPVRDEIVILGSQEKPAPGPGFRVLIVGGSQGAQAINRAMADALSRLAEVKGLEVVHQTGSQDETWMRRAYEESGVPATVQSFYNDMAALYNQADLIICRAGATTVAEITTIGKAAVFIPFPHAADDHQTGNARALVAAGAALMIPQEELDGKRLADTIITLMQDRGRLERLADNARSLGRPEAAVTIVNDIYGLMQRNAEEGADGH